MSISPRRSGATAGVEVLLFDRQGQPIYAPGAGLAGHRKAGQRLPAASADRAMVVHWQDGQGYVTATAALRPRSSVTDLGWTVVVRQAEALAFAAARQAVLLALVIGLVGALAAEQANAELDLLAHHDPLTGVLNWRGLDQRLADLLAGARRRQAPVSMLVFDADHFKRINDRYGHDAGDAVLRAIAHELRQRVREVDLVARVGGEEFVLVLPDTGGLGACHVAAAMVARIAALSLPAVGGVTISCGATELALGRESGQEALRRADAELYAAKAQGRNRHVFVAADEGPTLVEA